MKTIGSIAAVLTAAGLAEAALVGQFSDSWSGSATPNDTAIDELYTHVSGAGNNYLGPDSNENRYANGAAPAQWVVTGHDTLELYDLGSRAANVNFFGIRVSVGEDSYEVTLTPNTATGAATDHYFTSVNQILTSAGGPALESDGIDGGTTTETALLDFFIYDVSRGVKTYSSGIGNPAASPERPVFDYTPDLLENPGPSTATPLPGGSTSALALLGAGGYSVWGFEDLPGQSNDAWRMEPDYNDHLIAFRIIPAPEPSTYGLIGAAALASLIGYRCFRRRNVN